MSIYLDNAATTKPLDSVLNTIKPYLEDYWYNPSSIYSNGTKVKNDIEAVRNDVAKLINASSEEIYFTSGASESNNWVIRGFDDANFNNESVIITTPIEHKSIINAVNNPVLHSDVCFCKVFRSGLVDYSSLATLLKTYKDKSILVSVIMANNEIGTIQDIKMLSNLVHSYNGILHTDATQALKYMPIDVEQMGIDLLSASAQKIGGLKGTGFLYKKNGIELPPLIYGEQEKQYRGGTENVVGIIALGEAIKHIDCGVDKSISMRDKRAYLIMELSNRFHCTLNGAWNSSLSNNINVTFPQNITGEALIYMLDLSNIMVSSGSACNSHLDEPSHVLKAIGLTDEEAARTIRFSLSDDITYEQIDNVLCELEKQIELLLV